ncbi:MAG: formate dehydrogenase accessory sulfurtransferase FdhD [Oscillospiraceae bacterium]|nr:formate dehydrogenase accessory sulfurtransferase FdhD [Oscillospiraceae bacterium]
MAQKNTALLTGRRVYADGHETQSEISALRELFLSVCVNDRLWKRLNCTACDLPELVTGRLYTEGRIGAAAEIESLQFPSPERAEVRLSPAARRRERRRVEPAAWEKEWIFDLARRFQVGMPLHRETFSAHCAFLQRRGKLLYAGEDIGRHNAVDKAVGFALLRNIPLSECVLFTSGRVPSDMVEKAVAAGIPVLASKASPTAEAVRLAQDAGLTLICRAREDNFTLFAP